MDFDPPPPLLPDIVSPQVMQHDITETATFITTTATTILPQQQPSPTPPQAMQHQPPPLPPPRQQQQLQLQQIPPQLPDIVAEKVVEEFEKIMSNENDNVVLTNSVCLLFRFSIDNLRGYEVCQAMSASPEIMSRLYYILLNEQFKFDDVILCYATGNLTNLSKYQEGREAILSSVDGVRSLLRSLQSNYSNVVIFAITAIHNLLLDRKLIDVANEQIKHGLQYIVELLDNKCLIQNYEFKVIVLDCLQILAYGNNENRIAIRKSGGPYLILKTIKENLDNPATDELIETASRLLKSLSACPENKRDIIQFNGISILTSCIKRDNNEILKTCLWTLRNLSDLINRDSYLNLLVARLLQILEEYVEDPCITTCALGILANVTCNNEEIKQFICEQNGVDILINTITDYNIVDQEIFEPAICALCHLMNQPENPEFAKSVKRIVIRNYNLFKFLRDGRIISADLSKAIDKLINLTNRY